MYERRHSSTRLALFQRSCQSLVVVWYKHTDREDTEDVEDNHPPECPSHGLRYVSSGIQCLACLLLMVTVSKAQNYRPEWTEHGG
jgi:hypothetical protein